MTIFQALRHGITDLHRSRRMLLLFYAATTLPALIAATVVMAVPFGSLNRSTWATAMAINLDLSWIVETATQSALPAMPILVAVIGVFFLARLLHIFLLGGALRVFATGRPYATEFFVGCGRDFWRILRLALFSLLFFAAAMALHSGLGWAGNKVWGEGNEATPLIHWSWFTYSVLAVTLGLCSLAFDYGAIRLVTDDSRKAVRAYLGAFRLIWRAPTRTLGLYVIIWLIALLLLGAYQVISQVLSQTSMALVFLLFLVRQCAVLARAWTRLLFYSSQSAMYADLRPPAPPVIQPEPELELAPEPVPGPAEATPPPASESVESPPDA